MAERVGFEPTRHFCLRALQARLIVHSSTSPAERVGFEPTAPTRGAPLFESGSINHSDTSPHPIITTSTPLGKRAAVYLMNMVKNGDEGIDNLEKGPI